MKKNHHFSILAFVALFLSAASLFGQTKHQKWELGLIGGVTQGQNDLQNFDGKEQNFGFGGLVRYHINDNIGLRLNVLRGKMTASDANYDRSRARGFTFESPLTEAALLGEWDILGRRRFRKLKEGGTFKRTISPYLFGGVGFAFMDGTTTYGAGNPTAVINQDIAAGSPSSSFVVPVGAGLKIDLTQKLVLNLEAGTRRPFRDDIDGVSNAGNPDNDDTYSFIGAALSYRLGGGPKDTDGDGVSDDKDKCPTEKGIVGLMGCPDRDGDGVADKDDMCPDARGLTALMGCPDRDSDGVADDKDACPDVAGIATQKGCPDRDADGITDADDACPDVKGTVTMRGCPDTDGDGISDKEDACPNEKGTKENKGCPVKISDRDNDGIADAQDACPDVKGTSAFKGCPDTDGDGVEDSKDKCPTTAGLVSNQGCPEIKAEDKKILEDAIYGVQFDVAKSTFKQESYTILNNVVDVMKRNAGYNLSIGGHTDSDGAAASNQKLSEARAKACYDYFVSKGIDAKRMMHTGFGSTKPVADNKTAANKAKNRRVEFELKGK